MAYITRAMLKAAVRIGTEAEDPEDPATDLLLDQALEAASGSIDERCGRTFGRDVEPTTRVFRTHGKTVRVEHGELLLVDDIATDAGLVVEVGDGRTWSVVDENQYEVSPDNVLAKKRPVTGLAMLYSWWSLYRRVRVTAVWGWPEVPPVITQAALLQALRFYRRKDSPEGVLGVDNFGLIRVPHLDPDVRALVEPFRLPGFGDD